ncbi:MAG TPA: hypothetical protein VEY10_05795, partial [Flavisolibacter sp.]|nr:hypothetical protein [Flavisolibacter sp.]
MKRLTAILLLFFFKTLPVTAQPFASWSGKELILNNGVVERTISLPSVPGPFITTLYKPVQGSHRFFEKESPDFQFEVSGTLYSGKGNWTVRNVKRHNDSRQGDGAAITLLSQDKKIELTIQFLLYPDLPVVRKNLEIKNLSSKTAMVESVDVEKFDVTGYSASTFSWICHDYGRRRSIGPYNGNMQDALVTVHNSDWEQGIVIGNEASGVLKHTAVFWEELAISSGLTHKNAVYPFRKYLQPSEVFVTPQVFT